MNGSLEYGQKHGSAIILLLRNCFQVLAVEVWAKYLQNRCIIFHTDNIACVYIINKLSSKDCTLMVLVRRLVIQSLKYNILFKAEHLPGIRNDLSDKLSSTDHRVSADLSTQTSNQSGYSRAQLSF